MPNKITFFPTPLPDEHIFSTVARWYVLHKHESLNNLLFLISHKNLTLNPSCAYNPFYRALFDIFGGKFEPEIFFRHTLIPYYQTFTYKNISKEFHEGNGNKIFPFQQSKMIAAKNWRWCCDCAVEDMETHGTTYWHVSHQLPSTIHCHKHSKALIHSCECGLISDSFINLKLPPAENYCPCCKKIFNDTSFENELVNWLDSTSWKLMHSDASCKVSRIKSKLIEKIPLSGLKIDSMTYLKKIRIAQNEFNQFLAINDIEEKFFIVNPKPYSLSEKLKIGRFIHSNEFQLPIFYLLLLKFFVKDEYEIERTLFGSEDSGYDEDTKSCIIL